MCIYSYMFKLSVNFKVFSIWCNKPIEAFSHCSRQFLNLSVLMLFSASVGFCFTSPTLAKHFPFRTFFHPGKQKKISRSGQDWVNREGWARRSCCLWPHRGQNLLNTHAVWAGVLWITHHEMGKCLERVFKKIFTEAKGSLSQHWCSWVPRTLTQRGKPEL